MIKKKKLSVHEIVCIQLKIIHSLQSQLSFQYSSCYYCVCQW